MIEKVIDEEPQKNDKTPERRHILDGVACEAKYAKCRPFCPRSIYPYWREIWLEGEAQAEKKMSN